MSETRRNLFKTSILSAIGVISIAAVFGGALHFLQSKRSPGDDQQPGPYDDDTSPIVGYSTDDKTWYVFNPDGAGKYLALKTKTWHGTYSPSQVPFDTKEYLASAKLDEIKNALIKIGPYTITVSNGYVTDSANLRQNTNHWTFPSWFGDNFVSGLAWNEVGRK